MISNKNLQKIIFYLILLLPIFTFNEYFIENFISEDNQLEIITKYKIRFINLLNLALLTIFFIYEKNFILYFDRVLKVLVYDYKKIKFLKIKNSLNFITIFIFLFLAFYSFQFSYDLNILSGLDTDATHIVKGAFENEAYLAPYGVLYAKIAILFKIILLLFIDLNPTETQFLQHFVFLLINSISVCIITYVFTVISGSRTIFIFLTFTCLLLTIDPWSSYLTKVRVDLLLSALTALFLFFDLINNKKKNIWFQIFSNIFAGLALSCKISFIIILLPFFVLQLIKSKKITYVIRNSLIVFFTYLIISFPEVLTFENLINFIKWVSYFSLGFTFESVLFRINSFLYSLVIIIPSLIYLSNKKEIKFDKYKIKNSFLYFIFLVLIPMIYLSKEIKNPSEHYIFPISTITILLILNYFSNFNKQRNVNYKKIKDIFFKILTIFLLIISFKNLYNKYLFNNKLKNTNEKIFSYLKNKSYKMNILVDGYIPRDIYSNKFVYCYHLSCEFKFLKDNNIGMIVLHKNETKRILDDNEKFIFSVPNRTSLKIRREFYGLFNSKKRIIKDKFRNKWKKVNFDKNYIIWEKIEK